MKFSSNILLRLPLMLPALFFALISFVMFYVCFAETSVQVPSFVQKFCIFVMALFLAWLTVTFIRIGFRDFFVAIEPGDDEVRFQGLFTTVLLKWDDIRQVQESASTLSITASNGATLNVSTDLNRFEEFRDLVMAKKGKPGVVLYPPPVSPDDITYRERM